METLLRFFKKDERSDEYMFAEEQDMFKSCFKRYCIRKIKGRVELWARDTLKPQSYFIGKLVGNDIQLTREFHTFPYDVVKGSAKLIRIFLHNDWRD